MVQNDNDKSAITNGGGEGSKFGVVTTSVASSEPYNPRKPKWWKALAGRATKSQKRAIRSVLDDRGLRLPEVPFGSTLDWNNVFPPASVVVDAIHATDDEACKEQNHGQQQRDIWLELGFGRGENLLALAHLYRNPPQFYLVGAEIHNPGIGVVCQHIQQGWDSQKNHNQGNDDEGEDTTCHDDDVISGYWKDYVLYSTNIDPFPHSDIHHTHTFQGQYDHSATPSTPNLYEARAPYSNLRIHAGDGFKLLPKIPSDSLACILVTFPDPFPKEEQKQWRLIQVHTLLQFHRILRKAIIKQDDPTDDGLPVDTGENLHLPATLFLGHYFYLATDHSGYFDWVHETMQRLNSTKTYFRLIDPCPDRMGWLPAVSTYEQKGWREGRRTHMACWEAVEENA